MLLDACIKMRFGNGDEDSWATLAAAINIVGTLSDKKARFRAHVAPLIAAAQALSAVEERATRFQGRWNGTHVEMCAIEEAVGICRKVYTEVDAVALKRAMRDEIKDLV